MSTQFCEFCLRIAETLEEPPDSKTTTARLPGRLHQPSFDSLTASVSAGCKICTLFHRALVDTCAEARQCSEAAAVEYLQSRDEYSQHGFAVVPAKVQILRSLPGFIDYAHAEEYMRYIGINYRREREIDRPFSGHSPRETATQEPFPGDKDDEVILPVASHRRRHPTCIGRAVGVEPDLNLCKSWLKDCSDNHSKCAKIRKRSLPTRLIDVGRNETKPIKLVESHGQFGQYLTLSHRWGASNPLVTDVKNCKAHLSSIPFADLPRTFQDAVTITRFLGFRYLWIDCLCIIQGPGGDWETECRLMEEVYENSAATIAGPALTSPNDGLLHTRPESKLPPCPLPQKTSQGGKANPPTISLNLSLIDRISLRREKNSALARRGWVLQERLLSPRVVHFGTSQLYFECNSTDRFECCRESLINPPLWDDHYVPKQALRRALKDDRDRKNHSIWYDIVESFSYCQLTYVGDKLPALSGLARRFYHQIDDQYFAGLWWGDLVRGLSWYSKASLTLSSAASSHGQIYSAGSSRTTPTWSWVANDSVVQFPYVHYEASDRKSQYKYGASVIRAEVVPYSEDRFVRVESGTIEIAGLLHKFILHVASGSDYRMVYTLEGLHIWGAMFYLDNKHTRPLIAGDLAHGWTCQCMLMETWNNEFCGWNAIALLPVDGARDVFYRIGLVRRLGVSSGDYRRSDWVEECPEWNIGVEKRRITLV